jgi:hypothetical protein
MQAILFGLLMGAPCSAGAGEAVTLVCGFEEADARAWGAKPKDDALRWQVSQYRAVWFRRGDVTEGDWALVVERGGAALRSGRAPYNVLRRGALLNSYRWFAKRFPTDWSGHDRLRLDVKSTAAAGRLRIDLEDVLCEPMVRRTFALPKGRWVTLEFDLAAASKVHRIELPERAAERFGVEVLEGRVLNLARMANITVYLEQLDAKSTLLLDNLRIVREGAKIAPKRPVVRDDRPFPAPQALPMVEPEPPRLPEAFTPAPKPVRPGKPFDVDISKAGKTTYPRVGGLTARAFAAADGRHLLLGFLAGYVHVLQTRDGGKTWTGLDGKPAPSRCYHDANAPSHCAAAAGADMLYAYTDHCAGGGNPSNLFFRRLRFEGAGWRLGPVRLLDVDCRHCPEWKVRLLGLPSGRLWASWMHLDRFGKLGVRARYSDDGGRTWQDPDSNALRIVDRDNSQGPQRLGVTLWLERPKDRMPAADERNGRLGAMYSRGHALLTPYRGRVACLWAKTWHPNAVWRAFDGHRWGPERSLGRGNPVSAVTVGKDAIHVTMGYKRRTRLLRLEGEKWVEDSPPEGRAGVLSVSGQTVYSFWTKREGEKTVVYECHKPKGGDWSQPSVLARETVPGEGPRARLGLTVPQYAPGAFIPVAWGPRRAWIRTMQLPTR